MPLGPRLYSSLYSPQSPWRQIPLLGQDPCQSGFKDGREIGKVILAYSGEGEQKTIIQDLTLFSFPFFFSFFPFFFSLFSFLQDLTPFSFLKENRDRYH